jgi:hypothetical protein
MIKSEQLANKFMWMHKAIDRILGLHQKGTCNTPICIECNADWPCDTVKALIGAKDE